MKNVSSCLLFWLGVFSMTEVHLVGSMAISEVLIFTIAPWLFIKDFYLLKHDGFLPFISLVFATMASCAISSVLNETFLPMAERGLATIYAIFAITVVMHRLLRGNLKGMRWFILGWSISIVINIFVFQKSVEIGRTMGNDVAGAILSDQFLWMTRIGDWIMTPIRGWYLQMPLAYSVFAPLAFAVYFILSSESGRSAALVSIASSVMLLLGGKKRSSMSRAKKHFGALLLFAVVGLVIFKIAYTYTAKSGLLGEKALEKYELQTGGRDSTLAILMGGRGEFFMGLFAAVRRPIFGYGPWPIDDDNIAEEFIYKYGSVEDVRKHEELKTYLATIGASTRLGFIPTHSHLIGFWVWYGLAGLLLWIYVLYIAVKVTKNALGAIPQWYGMLCLFIPSIVWHIFFSPFGTRVPRVTLIVCLLLAKAVAEGRLRLPLEMEQEAWKYEA